MAPVLGEIGLCALPGTLGTSPSDLKQPPLSLGRSFVHKEGSQNCPVPVRVLWTIGFMFPGPREDQDLFLDWRKEEGGTQGPGWALAENRCKAASHWLCSCVEHILFLKATKAPPYPMMCFWNLTAVIKVTHLPGC